MKESSLQEQLEAAIEQLEELKQMIREASTLEDLNDLHHHVGPSQDESDEAEKRLQKVDRISDRCVWSKFEFECNADELLARQQWQSIMQVQGAFETKYF